MIEVLCRGKIIHYGSEDGRWFYGVPVPIQFNAHPTNDIELVNYFNYDEDYDAGYPLIHSRLIDPKTLGRYTGVIDKNDDTIYEGDILSVEFTVQDPKEGEPDKYYEKGIVEYSEEYLAWHVVYPGVDWVPLDDLVRGSGICLNAEVIGNIWDNPDIVVS